MSYPGFVQPAPEDNENGDGVTTYNLRVATCWTKDLIERLKKKKQPQLRTITWTSVIRCRFNFLQVLTEHLFCTYGQCRPFFINGGFCTETRLVCFSVKKKAADEEAFMLDFV